MKKLKQFQKLNPQAQMLLDTQWNTLSNPTVLLQLGSLAGIVRTYLPNHWKASMKNLSIKQTGKETKIPGYSKLAKTQRTHTKAQSKNSTRNQVSLPI